MGKKLIIKGADFSINGLAVYTDTWYIRLGTTYLADMGSVPTRNSDSGAWSFDNANNALIQGKTINQIKFVPADAGNFYIFVLDSRTSSLGTAAATISVSSADIGNLTRYSFPDISIGAGQYLAFVDPSQTVRMYYAVKSGQSFYKRCGFSDTVTVNGYQLLIDVGYRSLSE